MVGVGTGDNGTEHDGLVWLVLEVTVPQLVELRTHLLELRLGGADLEASINGVGRQPSLLGAGIPLGADLPLNLLDTTKEVVGSDGLVGDTVDYAIVRK